MIPPIPPPMMHIAEVTALLACYMNIVRFKGQNAGHTVLKKADCQKWALFIHNSTDLEMCNTSDTLQTLLMGRQGSNGLNIPLTHLHC